MQIYSVDGQITMFAPESWSGRMSPEPSPAERRKARTSASSSKRSAALKAIPYMFLDLTPGHGNLLGEPYWEMISPWRGDALMLNTGVSPRDARESSLWQILEEQVPQKYYLSPKACLGILRRAWERGKELPPQLKTALMMQAGLMQSLDGPIPSLVFHINQREETIDLGKTAGALMATANMQMQTFISQQPTAFATNQRDEVRDLRDVAGAICTTQSIKQQTLVAEGCLNPWDTQQKRVVTPDSTMPTLAGADGKGGRSPGGLLLAASSAGAGRRAGGIGYSETAAPTLKAGPGGNTMPSILCLNDQGGERMDITIEQTMTLRAGMGNHQPLVCLNDQGGGVMDCSEDVAGTLRAQEHGHQPLVFDTHGQDCRFQGPTNIAQTVTAAFGTGGGNTPLVVGDQPQKVPRPLVFENHGIDGRYTGPHKVSPTLSARAGTGGNNLPLVSTEPPEESPVIFFAPTERHTMFRRQRSDLFDIDEKASTQSARQLKEATDLIYQETVGALTCGDRKGPNAQYVNQDKLVVEGPLLIRRLTPLECERLQGFPDGWTSLPGASDSARYKALGNSVAIPCVEYVLSGIAAVLKATI